MLKAKAMRKLANKSDYIDEAIKFYGDEILDSANRGHTEVYLPTPRSALVMNKLKKLLKSGGFKYNITKDDSLKISW